MLDKRFSAQLRVLGLAALLVIALACAKPAPPEPVVEEPPPPPPPVEHVVKYSGETLGAIARWYTGKSSNWEAIVAANEGLDPRRINIGTSIVIPRELVTREDAMPKSAVGMRASGQKGQAAGSSTAAVSREAEKQAEDSVPEAEKEVPVMTEEERLRRDLEAAIAAEVSSDDEMEEAAAVEETVEVAEPEVVESLTGSDDAASANVEDVDRERLLDELLAE